MAELRFRQVHLDFHTSPDIPDVGHDFDPDTFAETLVAAHVDSITVFARCHHGLCYYPTKVSTMHPSLKHDLLGEMIEACHTRGIRVPVYTTVVWDEHMARVHPGWQQVSLEGVAGVTPANAASWKYMCMNSPYLDYVVAQTEEVVQNYPVDGMFFDIVFQVPPGCCCPHCIQGMREAGLEPFVPEDMREFSHLVANRAMERLSAVVRRHRPEASIFFNGRVRLSGDEATGVAAEMRHMTHLEVESLPSGEWGYLHYPMTARYVQSLDVPFLGMTARFHKSWADFGGLKNRAALEFETFSMLATGGACSIGDQLHPRGRLEKPAYDLIGAVYASVEAKEPWCAGAKPVREVAVLTGADGRNRQDDFSAEEGATLMLLEMQRQFQFVGMDADLSGFTCAVLPEDVEITPDLVERLQRYADGGGALLVAGAGWQAGGQAAEQLLGITAAEAPPYSAHYIAGKPELGLEDMPHVMYEPLVPVKADAEAGTTALAQIICPYFERTWQHFSSHRQTAPDAETDLAAVVQRGRVVYVASPIFGAYRRHGNRQYREIVAACLKRIIGVPVAHAELPSAAHVSLLRQAEEGRLVCHLLYYPAERRTTSIDIIEDIVPLLDFGLKVRTETNPRAVYLAPSRQPLHWRFRDGVTEVRVPELRGHQMVVYEL